MQTSVIDNETPETGTMIVNLRTAIPEVGKIKIGRKKAKQQGRDWRLPEKLGYFLITTLQRDSQDDFVVDLPLMDRLAKEQEEVTGKAVPLDNKKVPKVTEIPVMLLSDDIEDSIKANFSFYSGRKRVAVCDGRWCTYFHDKKGPLKPPRIVRCTGEHETLVDGKGRLCFKPHTTVSLVVRSSAGGMRFGGVHKFRTTSIISLEQMVGSLKLIQGLTRGFLANLPLALVVRPMQVAPNGQPTTVHVVHFELRADDLNALQQRVIELAQAESSNVRALLEARRDIRSATMRDEDELEQADVQEEFHPGQETVIEVPATAVPVDQAETAAEPETETEPEPAKAAKPAPPAAPAAKAAPKAKPKPTPKEEPAAAKPAPEPAKPAAAPEPTPAPEAEGNDEDEDDEDDDDLPF